MADQDSMLEYLRTNMTLPSTHADSLRALKATCEADIVLIDVEISRLNQASADSHQLAAATSTRARKQSLVALCDSYLSPIRRLPIELLEKTFMLCVPKKGSASLREAPLSLCHVSAAWRTTAIGLSRLWSVMSLPLRPSLSSHPPHPPHFEHEKAIDQMSMWLKNARRSPLSLSVTFNSESESASQGSCSCLLGRLDSDLRLHSNHIRHLQLRLHRDIYKTPHFLYLPCGRVEQLEYLDFSSTRHVAKTITAFQSAPRLRKVKIVMLDIDWLGTDKSPILFRWAQLTHLGLPMSTHINVLQSVLRQCRFLHQCDFTISEYSEPFSIPDLDTRTVLPCLNLMMLNYHFPSEAPYTWFSSFAFPVLAAFTLRNATLSSDWLHYFQQALQYQPHSLRHLVLDDVQVSLDDLCTFLHSHSELATLNITLMSSSPRMLWEAMTFNDAAESDGGVETLPLSPELERLEIRVPQHRHEVDFAWPEFVTMIKSRWDRRPELVSGEPDPGAVVARLRSIELGFEAADESRAVDAITLLEDYRSEGMDVLIAGPGARQAKLLRNEILYDPFEW